MSSRRDNRVRFFPVLWPIAAEHAIKRFEELGCPRYLPWAVVEPVRREAWRRYGYTLERLARLGGLGPVELVSMLDDRAPGKFTEQAEIACIKRLRELAKGSSDGR